jgi:hypothetical protein
MHMRVQCATETHNGWSQKLSMRCSSLRPSQCKLGMGFSGQPPKRQCSQRNQVGRAAATLLWQQAVGAEAVCRGTGRALGALLRSDKAICWRGAAYAVRDTGGCKGW